MTIDITPAVLDRLLTWAEAAIRRPPVAQHGDLAEARAALDAVETLRAAEAALPESERVVSAERRRLAQRRAKGEAR